MDWTEHIANFNASKQKYRDTEEANVSGIVGNLRLQTAPMMGVYKNDNLVSFVVRLYSQASSFRQYVS